MAAIPCNGVKSIFTEDKAIAITCRLLRDFWIDSLVLLRDGIKHDPELLSALDIPKHLQLNITSKLSSASDPVKPLDTLGVNDVKALMASIFPDEVEYVRAIGENRINGFVLTSIDCKSPQSLSKLKGYGISSEIHADVLRMHLSQWVQSGVPIRYLAGHSSRSSSSSTKAAIKPEQCRSNSSSSGSVVPTNHTKSRDIHNDQDRHSDVPIVSDPIEAAVSHHEESRSVRSDAPPAAVARPDEVMDFDVVIAHPDEVMDFDRASFGNTMSLVSKPNNSAKSHLVCNHPNASLPTDDSRWTRSKGCSEASTNPISKRKEDGLLSPSDRVVNKRHKPQVQVSDTDAAGSRPSYRSSATASALLNPSKDIASALLTDDPSQGLFLRGSSSSSRPPTSRVSVASDRAPASSGDKAASAASSSSSSSSSRPSNVLYIVGYPVPSPDDLLDHRDNTKLQALSWLATLVKSKVSEVLKPAFIKQLVADGYLKIAIALIGDKDNVLHHNVTYKALVLLNHCVCAVDEDVGVLEHVISEGGLTKALTHCMSNDYECRNQSLWVVGNISVDDREAKSRIPCGMEHRARIVAESYKSISRFTAKQQFVLRSRYAETFCQVSSETMPESFPSLRVFLEPLTNIISLSDQNETVDFACQALYSLLDGADSIIVDAFIDQHVVERLREKLHHLTTAAAKKQKPAMLDAIIGTLDAIAGCSTDEQLLELTCITPYLVDIVAAEKRDNNCSSIKKKQDKLLITTLTCVASICEGDSRILEKTFEYRRDDLFLTMLIKVLRSTLFIIVHTAPPRLNMEHYNCYLSIAFAVSAADAEQIDYFISLHTGVYGFLFDALISLDVGYKEHVKQVVKIILCTFNALCNLIKLKSVNQEILTIQRTAESSGLASLHGWAKVRYLAYDYSTEVVAIPEEALKLYEMGIALGLVVPLNDAQKRKDEKEEG